MDDKLTRFQNTLLTALASEAAVRREVMVVEGCGESELYLLCKTIGCEIYIYDDGFNILNGNTDERFEAEDIPTIEFAKDKLLSVVFGTLQ